jgi:NAD(P)H-nitrite reductase large subunit
MRVFDLDVLTVGNPNPRDGDDYRIVQTGGGSREFYRRLVFNGERLVGAVLIGRIEQGGVLRALIENRMPIRVSDEKMMQPGFNFGYLL